MIRCPAESHLDPIIGPAADSTRAPKKWTRAEKAEEQHGFMVIGCLWMPLEMMELMATTSKWMYHDAPLRCTGRGAMKGGGSCVWPASPWRSRGSPGCPVHGFRATRHLWSTASRVPAPRDARINRLITGPSTLQRLMTSSHHVWGTCMNPKKIKITETV